MKAPLAAITSAYWYYRDHMGQGSISFIPSLYTFTSQIINYTPCDSCYVLNDSELPLAAIGRFPVRTVAELANMLAKNDAWEALAGSPKHALLIADEYDFKGQLEGAATLSDFGDNWYATRFLLQELLQGKTIG